MDTKDFKVTVGNPNIVIDRESLEERARKVGVTENNIELRSDSELNSLVIHLELTKGE